jgi:hypothetical protein
MGVRHEIWIASLYLVHDMAPRTWSVCVASAVAEPLHGINEDSDEHRGKAHGEPDV